MINVQQFKLVYDYFTNNLPIDLTSLFSLSSEVHNTNLQLNSARKCFFHISKINTETYGNKSIKHQCSTLWNEIYLLHASLPFSLVHIFFINISLLSNV